MAQGLRAPPPLFRKSVFLVGPTAADAADAADAAEPGVGAAAAAGAAEPG